MAAILVVEDESHLAKGLKLNLELEGNKADILDRAEEALTVFADYNLMILDIMLPGMNGLELLKRIRLIDNKFPVLIVSARSSEDELVEGLQAGADDYITKPFSLPELMLRVKRMLERQAWYRRAAQSQRQYSFGDFQIDFDSFEAQTKYGVITLTQYECYVMKYLIENKDRPVPREELLEKVWGYSVTPDTRTVDTFILRLRKLFEDDRKNPRHLISYRSVGYRFFD